MVLLRSSSIRHKWDPGDDISFSTVQQHQLVSKGERVREKNKTPTLAGVDPGEATRFNSTQAWLLYPFGRQTGLKC